MADERKLHIAMFPWLAFGHMIPFLELAKLIAQKGHKVSYISTPKNIDRLPKVPHHLAPLIDFVNLPLPQVNNLPPDAEATTDLPLKYVGLLENAYDSLPESLTKFLKSSLPDWILYDFSPYWLPDIAKNLNIQTVFFSIFTACCITFGCPPSGEDESRRTVEDYTVKPKWVPFPSTLTYRHFESVRNFPVLDEEDPNITTVFYRFRETIKKSDIIAVRSIPELEADYLNLLEQIHHKPAIPIGVLPSPIRDAEEEGTNESWRGYKQWLDHQEKKSVVYIAFGSEAKPSQQELEEIAVGLELSGLPFFWVLRKRRGLADPDVIELPEGFEERTKGRGIICTSWAPQMKILAHEAVGVFLTHSGWSSVVEALQLAIPLVLLTFYADQGLNAKLFQEKKIGYLIPRREEDGYFSSNAVAESLRTVIFEEEGKIYRDKAMEMKALFSDMDTQNYHVDNFLVDLQNKTRPKN